MSALDANTARRMRGVLGLFLSDSEGERLAAVDALLKLLGKADMTLFDLVPEPMIAATSWSAPFSMGDSPKAGRRSMYPGPAGAPLRAALLAEHQLTARRLMASATVWSDRERDFLASMASRSAGPTDRQAQWLNDLAAKSIRHRAERERADA